jgi:CheY-like chemotaxis protein
MSRTVLVVDDEPPVLDVTAAMLEELGCKVVTAADAFEALAELAANQAIEPKSGSCGVASGGVSLAMKGDDKGSEGSSGSPGG